MAAHENHLNPAGPARPVNSATVRKRPAAAALPCDSAGSGCAPCGQQGQNKAVRKNNRDRTSRLQDRADREQVRKQDRTGQDRTEREQDRTEREQDRTERKQDRTEREQDRTGQDRTERAQHRKRTAAELRMDLYSLQDRPVKRYREALAHPAAKDDDGLRAYSGRATPCDPLPCRLCPGIAFCSEHLLTTHVNEEHGGIEKYRHAFLCEEACQGHEVTGEEWRMILASFAEFSTQSGLS